MGAAQVHHGRHAELADQRGDVRRGQVLQVIGAQQPARDGLAAVLGGQAAQVTDVHGTLKINPRHDSILAGAAASWRDATVNPG